MIVLCGGGSGGHVRPLESVAEALSTHKNSPEIVYIGARQDSFAELMASSSARVTLVNSGKFRRYANTSKLRQLLDVPTVLRNLRDLLLAGIGTIESIVLLRRVKPEIIFSKGGFPAVPVIAAARILNVPVITHDSDERVSLAHRLIAGRAVEHLVASDANYPYPGELVEVVGVPLSVDFYRGESRATSRKRHEIASSEAVCLIIGGSLGSAALNEVVARSSDELQDLNLKVFHITGEGWSSEVGPHVTQIDFISDPHEYFSLMNAADVVVSRAGATSLAELQYLGKPSLVVPAPQLADQIANAERISDQEMIIVVPEDDLTPKRLHAGLKRLLAAEQSKGKSKNTLPPAVSGIVATRIMSHIQSA